MSFVVTASGNRGAWSEKFEELDDAVSYFKLAFAMGGVKVALEYDALATVPVESLVENFFFVPSSTYGQDDYTTSEIRCTCPSFVYRRKNRCKHMEWLSRFSQYAKVATVDDYNADMKARYN